MANQIIEKVILKSFLLQQFSQLMWSNLQCRLFSCFKIKYNINLNISKKLLRMCAKNVVVLQIKKKINVST